MPDRDRLHARQRGLSARVERTQNLRQTATARTLGDREDASDAPNPSVECKLTDRGMFGETSVRDLPRRSEHRERDRHVEAGPFLAKLGWRQVDDDPTVGPAELGRADRARDALLRLLAGAVGKADDRERRRRELSHVRLDLDAARLEPDECVGNRACEHRPRR